MLYDLKQVIILDPNASVFTTHKQDRDTCLPFSHYVFPYPSRYSLTLTRFTNFK